jgi:putative ABC transport system substrate-binding protein
MKRRQFITLLGGAPAWPLKARGQQAGRIYRLGILHNQGPQSPQFPPFYDELRRQGFVEGQNLIIDGRGYAVRTEQFPAVAADLAKTGVDAILAGGTAAVRAAQAATHTIPILTLTDDMVGQGLVGSLARPGGNTTGISILATELDGKRQQILMEMVPAARRMAVLADANTATSLTMRALQEETRARGVELAVRLVERPERIVPEIEEALRGGAQGLNVLASPLLYARRLDIFERTAALRLPTIYQSPEFAEEGGLIGYRGAAHERTSRTRRTRSLHRRNAAVS